MTDISESRSVSRSTRGERERETTHGVIGQEVVFGNVAGVRDDVKEGNEEANHDSERPEVHEPCRGLASNLAQDRSERRARSCIDRLDDFTRASDDVRDREDDELQDRH